MRKYIVTITFNRLLGTDFWSKLPEHRAVINSLINKQIVEYYTISAERSQGWILFNAKSPEEIINHLGESPLYEYFEISTDELMVYDSQLYRFPAVILN